MANWYIKQTVELNDGDHVLKQWKRDIMPLAYPGDKNAHVWQVTAMENGNLTSLGGHSVTGYFYREYDGETVSVTGEVVGAVASVAIPKEAYAYPGRVTGLMRVAYGGAIVTLGAISFLVGDNLTSQIIDPGQVIPVTVEELVSEIQALEAANTTFATIRDEISEDSRNLFYLTGGSHTYGDLVVTVNDDESVKFDGSVGTSTRLLPLMGCTSQTNYRVAAGTYIWDLEKVSGTASEHPTLRYYDSAHTSGVAVARGQAFTLTENSALVLRLTGDSSGGAAYDDAVYYFTIESGGTLHSYVPHKRTATDHVARSSIDEINETLEVLPSLKTKWNLFYPTNTSASVRYSGVTVTVDPEDFGHITLNGTATATLRIPLMGCASNTDCALEPGTISFWREKVAGTGASPSLRYRLEDGSVTTGLIRVGETVTLEQKYSLFLYATSGTTFTDDEFHIMIEEGATLHDEYIPAGTETAFDGWSRDAIQSILTADDLPEYYDKDELEERFAAIRSHISGDSVNNRGDMFAFITDPHFWNTGEDGTAHGVQSGFQSVKLLKLLMEKVNLPFIVNGGDMHSGSSATADTARRLLAEARAYYAPVWDHMYSILGNHEWNLNASGRLSIAEIYSAMLKDKEPYYGSISSRGDYWFDNAMQKIRYICIGCNETSGMLDAQVRWFGEEMLTVPAGYTVVVVTHAACQGSGGLHLNSTFEPFLSIIDAVNAKTSCTVSISGADRTFNYSGLDGVTVACVLSGHAHVDGDLASTGGVHIIATTCDACFGNTLDDGGSTIERAIGTKFEHAFDVVQIDTRNRMIYLTRFGASLLANKDRSFSYGS